VAPKEASKEALLPIELQEPSKEARRKALLTVIGLVVVLGVVGALMELFIAPLFNHDASMTLMQEEKSHAEITGELDFLIQMVPHHQEAIDTSRLVAQSTKDPALRALAESIVESQRVEVIQMNAWIDGWYGAKRYSPSYEPMMQEVYSLQGAARDEAYLRGMIEHHVAAIDMARQAQGFELRPEAAALADLIIRTQGSEVELMEKMLEAEGHTTVR
jgi:uncharacterized protein (DUF305 family)